MKVLLCTLAVLFLAGAVRAGNDFEEALAVLRKAETLDDEAVGFAGVKSETYKAFERLRKSATIVQLRKLLEDENPIVRCYALRALITDQEDLDVASLLAKRLNDTETVRTMRGCIVSDELVADVMLTDARESLPADGYLQIVATLIERKSTLAERDRALRRLDFPESWRPRIRKLVEGGDTAALPALARFRNVEDVELLRSALTGRKSLLSLGDALTAAEIFPHAKLFPALKAREPEARKYLAGRDTPIRLRFWFRALAAQKSPDAAKVLGRILDREVPQEYRAADRTKSVFEALAAHWCDDHAGLLARCLGEFAWTSPKVLGKLHGASPEKTVALVRKGLATRLNDYPVDAMGSMFELLRSADPEGAAKVLAASLPKADVHHIRALAARAAAWKHESFVEPLFRVLETNTNPHLYHAAAMALLCYDRPALDDRLTAAVEKHETLRTGWGGKRLAKLLEEKPRTWR